MAYKFLHLAYKSGVGNMLSKSKFYSLFLYIIFYLGHGQASYIDKLLYGGIIHDYSGFNQEYVQAPIDPKDFPHMVYSSDKKALELIQLEIAKIDPVLDKLKIPIAKFNVQIFPKVLSFDSSGSNGVQIYDQATYDPSTKTLNIFPADPNNKEQTPLWLMPHVYMHEIGHHIYYELYPIVLGNLKVKAEQKQDVPSGLYLRPGRNHRLVINALMEAFSDLFALYAIGFNNFKIDHKCMTNRDPRVSQFTNFYEKKFYSSLLDIYFSPYDFKQEISNCLEPYIQAEHTLGSIIAYQYNARTDLQDKNEIQRLQQMVHDFKTIHLHLEENQELQSPREFFDSVRSILKI